MKKMFIVALLVSASVYAGGSKLIEVDLDEKGTQIVKAELDVDDIYYYIDTTACVCWVSRIIGGSDTIATVDCKKLNAYSKLQQYVAMCSSDNEAKSVKK